MKRILSGFLGIAFVLAVFFLGILCYKNSNNVLSTVLFGLASAFIAPLGISALGYSFKRKDDTLEKMSKLPEIEKMILAAETQEEINLKLRMEKENLIKTIKAESQKFAKQERKKILEQDAIKILNELKVVDSFLNSYSDIENETDENIIELRQQIKQSVNNSITLNIFGENIEVEIGNISDIFNFPFNFLATVINRKLKKL
jgi:hypothetical protein